eukprot:4207325-Pyramimonas_sp.AAC.1
MAWARSKRAGPRREARRIARHSPAMHRALPRRRGGASVSSSSTLRASSRKSCGPSTNLLRVAPCQLRQ